jgi:L-lactate dehydrogenase complex protein LldG
MYDAFRARAEGVGAEVYRFKTRGEALDFVIGFIRQEGTRDTPQPEAVWADGPFLNSLDRERLSGMAPGLRFAVSRETAAEALIGISEAGFAVADTGSLVADQTDVAQRLVSTLPTIHIALIGTDRILPDKAAVFARISPATSRYIAFITGPSRTADIERVLTIGVHGPKRLVIVFVDEMEGVTV